MVVWMFSSMIVHHLVGAQLVGLSGRLIMLKSSASSLGLIVLVALIMQFSLDTRLALGPLVILSALVVRST